MASLDFDNPELVAKRTAQTKNNVNGTALNVATRQFSLRYFPL
jgi:hypothetical protein